MISAKTFVVSEAYAHYRPVAEVSLQQAIEIVALAIHHAREQKIARLLVDTRMLSGFDPPNTLERFSAGSLFARAAHGAVKVAIIAKPEMIDPEKFGITVARNRGLVGEVFTDEADALAWLLKGASSEGSTAS